MTTMTTDERIARLRAQLDEIDIEAAGDPIATAATVNEWAARDQTRRDRRVNIELEIRQLGQFGDLVGTPAMDAIRTFTTATADARTKLHRIATERTFGYLDDGRPRPRPRNTPEILQGWLQALTTLAATLPTHDSHASAYLCAEWDLWFRARNGFLQALAVDTDAARWVPWPEYDGGLPTGFAYGTHTEKEYLQ